MKNTLQNLKRTSTLGLAVAAAVIVTGCAGVVPAANIKPGFSNVAQVEQKSSR